MEDARFFLRNGAIGHATECNCSVCSASRMGASPVFVKDENVTFGYKHDVNCKCPECWEEKDLSSNQDKIFAGLLASIKLVNIHLLCIHARQKRIPRINVDPTILKKRDQYLLQSEAQALFKGNFIRLLKNVFSSSNINRIKRSCSFVVNIGTREEYPEVTWVLFFWDEDRYIPKEGAIIRECLLKSFKKLDTMLTVQCWKEAFEEWKAKGGDTHMEPVPIAANIHQVNLDSLKNIKF